MAAKRMKLTSYTNHAMRCLQLAALKSPELVRVDDVTNIHGILRPNVVKAVHQLGKSGYLETVRGRGGGFRLSRPANEIVVGEIVRLTEGPLEIVECFNPEKNTCPLIGICELSKKLQEATNAFMAVLDDVTIADIAANRVPLLSRIEFIENLTESEL
jgi:Rrf2 family nitric oxide-sensitive transcriptional repressor